MKGIGKNFRKHVRYAFLDGKLGEFEKFLGEKIILDPLDDYRLIIAALRYVQDMNFIKKEGIGLPSYDVPAMVVNIVNVFVNEYPVYRQRDDGRITRYSGVTQGQIQNFKSEWEYVLRRKEIENSDDFLRNLPELIKWYEEEIERIYEIRRKNILSQSHFL